MITSSAEVSTHESAYPAAGTKAPCPCYGLLLYKNLSSRLPQVSGVCAQRIVLDELACVKGICTYIEGVGEGDEDGKGEVEVVHSSFVWVGRREGV